MFVANVVGDRRPGIAVGDEAVAGVPNAHGPWASWVLIVIALGSATVLLTNVSSSFRRIAPDSGLYFSIWPDPAHPDQDSVAIGAPAEVGVRFITQVPGAVVGIRFYKGEANVGPHLASLWTNEGELLASAPFTNESTSGWQEAWFPEPVPIEGNKPHVASYFAPAGGYALSEDFFAKDSRDSLEVGPVRARPDRRGQPNGIILEGERGFPTASGNGRNYWVDVMWAPQVASE